MAYNVLTDLGANNLANDGTTDNVAHLNAAQTALGAGPYTLYWPAGTYRFASTPNAIPANVKWYGDGKDQTILKATRASHGTDSGFTASAANITLQDMWVTTTDDANSVNFGIIISNATNLTLERVKFSNQYAAALRAGNPAQVIATQCEFTNVYQDPTANFITGALQNSTLTACYFHDNNGLVNTTGCVYLNGNTNANALNVTFNGCVFQNYGDNTAITLKGEAGSDFAHALTVNGCTFSPNSHGIAAITTQTAFGVTITGNTFTVPYGNAIALYSTENFIIAGNAVNLTSTPGNTFCILANDGSQRNANGRISGNVVSNPYQVMNFGSGVQLDNALNVVIENNTFTGVYRGVGINQDNTGLVSNITIRGNHFLFPAGWVDSHGGGYYYGNYGTYYGVAVDGPVANLQVLDNVCQGLTYELLFTRFNYTGQAGAVKFRSASWPGDNTNAMGFQHSAAPTGLQQAASAFVPVDSSAPAAHGYAVSSF